MNWKKSGAVLVRRTEPRARDLRGRAPGRSGAGVGERKHGERLCLERLEECSRVKRLETGKLVQYCSAAVGAFWRFLRMGSAAGPWVPGWV